MPPKPKKKKKAKAGPAVDLGPTSAEVRRRTLFPCPACGSGIEQSSARKRARGGAKRIPINFIKPPQCRLLSHFFFDVVDLDQQIQKKKKKKK